MKDRLPYRLCVDVPGRVFLGSVAAVLAITALAKVFSAGGAAQVLSRPDPLLVLSTRQVLLLAALVELGVTAYLLAGDSRQTKLFLVLWLSSAFILYRLLLAHLAPGVPCPCLGTVTANMGIRQTTADAVLKVLIAYMFLGSSFFLVGMLLPQKGESKMPKFERAHMPKS